MVGVIIDIQLSHLVHKYNLPLETKKTIFRETERTFLNLVPNGRILEDYIMNESSEPENKVWLLRPEEKYGGQSYLMKHINNPTKLENILNLIKKTNLKNFEETSNPNLI